jgi:hypothetical protein
MRAGFQRLALLRTSSGDVLTALPCNAAYLEDARISISLPHFQAMRERLLEDQYKACHFGAQ